MTIGIIDVFEIIKIDHTKSERNILFNQRFRKANHVVLRNKTSQRINDIGDTSSVQGMIKIAVLYKLFPGIHITYLYHIIYFWHLVLMIL